ncbi:hypothetical protein HNR42_001636 [Deinobacterium chartae]|uniref:Pyridoxamine 5'-phosphate oxidase N-terminal domain-containing protein n=1 Tax=Deinobacterium chartae TaxID=521158 RepID=A0A841HXF3_9DEIO|nr:pyridoxamine 5'-phosphate oxidase family protein [Deinobacterium chartae]MBB6098211.1 hypothetical protein [Deinobacterium chartae]
MHPDDPYAVTSLEVLSALYGPPSERALLKQIDRLDAHCRRFIAVSPFVLLATAGPQGLDCSPRGDAPGFVRVLDDHTLLLPDRRGNNRIDSLRNVVQDPRVGLLFVVPGVNETLRVNGSAYVSTHPELLEACAVQGTLPRSALVIRALEVFMQCSRALVRSELWNAQRFVRREDLPSFGQVLAAHTGGRVNAAEYDAQAHETVRKTLY